MRYPPARGESAIHYVRRNLIMHSLARNLSLIKPDTLCAGVDLERQQIPYRLVNAYTVRKHREGDQIDRAKDDLRDAEVIANLLREGKFTQSQLLHGPHAALRQYAVSLTRLEGDMR